MENALLLHLFQNADIALIGDAAGLQNSAAAGNLYISLHTANPDETGSQTTSEVTYGAYARQPLVRSSSGWTVVTNTASNAAAVTFPEASSGTMTATYFGIGTAISGTGSCCTPTPSRTRWRSRPA